MKPPSPLSPRRPAGKSRVGSSKPVRSVERAVTILFCIAESRAPLGLSDICRSVGLDKATTLRLVNTLEKEGLVRKEEQTKRYTVGTEVNRLINSLQTDARRICRPYIDQLVAATGEAVCFNVMRGLERVVAETSDSHYELCISPRIGAADPIYVGASGKAIMAFLDNEKIEDIVRTSKLKPLTRNTISNPTKLRSELTKIRQQGYAISQGETLPGGAAVAAPVFDGSGSVIGAIDVRGPELRLDKAKLIQLAPLVVKCADAISAELGFHPDARLSGTRKA